MLEVKFVRGSGLGPAAPLRVRETRGKIEIQASDQFSDAQLAALNSIAEQILAGGQWFQLWQGEVVSMASGAEPKAA